VARRDYWRNVLAGAVLLALLLIAYAWFGPTPEPAPGPAPTTVSDDLERVPGDGGDWLVTEVIDGDTLKVQSGDTVERVRLLGINAPETYGDDECYGPQATAGMARWDDRVVTLYRDRGQDHRDRWGRLLAYAVTVENVDLSTFAVEQGLAREATYDGPYHLQATLRAVEAEARAAGHGLWGAC